MNEEENEKSYFDGGLLQLIGWSILGFLVNVCTLGICYPWAFTMVYNWETKHSVIDGKRFKFDGTAVQLFGNWIKWFLLTIITCGIYGLWLPIKLKKWKIKHTSFDYDSPVENEKSYFDGGLLQLIGWSILGFLVNVCTLGICYPWAFTMVYRWETKHTVIDGKRLKFDGTAVQLFGNWIKWFLLTIITCGIYGLWLPIKLKKWKIKHTHLLETEIPTEEGEGIVNYAIGIKNLTPEEIEAKKLKKEKERKIFDWVFLAGVVVMVLGFIFSFVYYYMDLFGHMHFLDPNLDCFDIHSYHVGVNVCWRSWLDYAARITKVSDFTKYISNFLFACFIISLPLIGFISLVVSLAIKLKKQKYNNILNLIGLITMGMFLLCALTYKVFAITPYSFVRGIRGYLGLFRVWKRFDYYFRWLIPNLYGNIILIIGYIATIVGFVKTKD